MKLNSSSHSLALTFPLRQSGFTLIELMIATTLGLLLLASLVYVYTNSAQSFRAQSALTLIQNNARYAFEIMGVDIRQTGFTGASSTPTKVVGTPNPTTLSTLIDLANPLVGYDNTYPPNRNPSGCTSACYRAGTDSLTVVRVDTENKYTVTAHDTGAFTFTLASWPTSSEPQAGEVFAAADYTHAAVFQAGTATSSPNVSYGAGGSPGNTTTTLGSFGSTPAAGTYVLALYRLSGVSYYIGTNPAGEPALYRDKLTHSGATLTSTAEELIEGVENMQITYGVDTDTDGDVDAYQDAGSVATWGNILSVRITLTLVSQQGVKIGTTGDYLLRKTFTNTIAIRNRLL
ncbi:MAG TPA: PilW family protein [Candidatus Competibacteraceae bacterium]|nr:PilW family protein [Candidatus Competibacteraceae bacterium]